MLNQNEVGELINEETAQRVAGKAARTQNWRDRRSQGSGCSIEKQSSLCDHAFGLCLSLGLGWPEQALRERIRHRVFI
jgi:hypothetical protein